MIIESACQASVFATQNLRRPKCPRCGNMLLVAEESCFDLKGRIHNVWSCDECSHEFETSVRLWRGLRR